MKYCFLMAVNKQQSFLKDAIDSVLAQTCSDFVFHIVANNCDDELWLFLQNFCDPRIRLYRTSIGQLAYNLNFGLDNIDGGYCLRMDADDISLPNRLEITKYALEKNSYPDFLAGSACLIDANGVARGSAIVKLSHKDLVSSLWHKNTILHPASALRVETVKRLRGYSGGFMSEDIDLWLRADRDKKVRFLGITDILIKYRIHSGQARYQRLGYAEGAGYRLREFIMQKKVKFLLGSFLGVAKSFIKGI